MGADGIKVLKPRNPDRLDAKFLYHFLSATDVPNAGYSRHFKFLRRLEVPLPPLDEQRRIAAILDKADALRCKRKRVIALFDDFIRSVFLDMFGDPQLAKSNMFRPLSQLVRSIDYGVTASANLNPVGPKFLRITDIQDGAVDWNAVPFCEAPISKLMAASLSTGDIVFARTGATTGKSFLIDCLAEDTVFASYLIRVSAGKNIIPEWLFHFFQTDFYWSYIKRSARGAAQGGVNATSLGNLPVPIIPIEAQSRFSLIAREVAAKKHRYLLSQTNLDALLASFQSRAFSGHL